MDLPPVELKHFARVRWRDVRKPPCMQRLSPRDSHFQLGTIINSLFHNLQIT